MRREIGSGPDIESTSQAGTGVIVANAETPLAGTSPTAVIDRGPAVAREVRASERCATTVDSRNAMRHRAEITVPGGNLRKAENGTHAESPLRAEIATLVTSHRRVEIGTPTGSPPGAIMNEEEARTNWTVSAGSILALQQRRDETEGPGAANAGKTRLVKK